jgi:phosphocarrier protein
LTIQNIKGLHARAAAKFVKTASSFDAELKVSRHISCRSEDESDFAIVSGKSILGLMMLAAEKGCKIQIEANGPQGSDVLQALAQLINDKFGEEE